jgi:hypothetical protein
MPYILEEFVFLLQDHTRLSIWSTDTLGGKFLAIRALPDLIDACHGP